MITTTLERERRGPRPLRSPRLLTSVNKENIPNFSLTSFLFSLFDLLPPWLVRHLGSHRITISNSPKQATDKLDVKKLNWFDPTSFWFLILRHLGAAPNPVDLWEWAVQGVQEVEGTAGGPHPALVSGLEKYRIYLHPQRFCVTLLIQLRAYKSSNEQFKCDDLLHYDY